MKYLPTRGVIRLCASYFLLQELPDFNGVSASSQSRFTLPSLQIEVIPKLPGVQDERPR
jgi:hypothetical protein